MNKKPIVKMVLLSLSLVMITSPAEATLQSTAKDAARAVLASGRVLLTAGMAIAAIQEATESNYPPLGRLCLLYGAGITILDLKQRTPAWKDMPWNKKTTSSPVAHPAAPLAIPAASIPHALVTPAAKIEPKPAAPKSTEPASASLVAEENNNE
jgi:hypothetical protein